jgi:predicted  nucleic acid-binding Zn-ribbon protein
MARKTTGRKGAARTASKKSRRISQRPTTERESAGVAPVVGVATSLSSGMDHLTQELRSTHKLRSASIEEMQNAAREELSEFANIRGQKASEYRAHAQSLLTSLVKNVAALRHAATRHMATTHKSLVAHQRTTADQLMELNAHRREATASLRDALNREVDAVRHEVNDFRAEALRRHSELAAERRRLHTQVAQFLSAIRADQARAHSIWRSYAMKGAAH